MTVMFYFGCRGIFSELFLGGVRVELAVNWPPFPFLPSLVAKCLGCGQDAGSGGNPAHPTKYPGKQRKLIGHYAA